MKINLNLIILMFLCILVGCNSESLEVEAIKTAYCPKHLGCLNEQFIEKFEEKCADKEKGCRFSFEEFFGDMDKVYFTNRMMIRFDECKTIPISEVLKESYTMLCQYILFEKNNEIKSYLRGFCFSDIKAKKNIIGFDGNQIDMVAVMDAGEAVLISKLFNNRKTKTGSARYYIEPLSSQLTKYREECISSP